MSWRQHFHIITPFGFLVSHFHTSSSFYIAPRQIGNFMRKVLENTKKKKSPCYVPNVNDTFSKLPKGSVSTNSKRVTILNKLFMRNITNLMSTEAYSSQILGLGVEINKVKITPDFKILKVYWISTSSQQDEAEEILTRNAGLLRHELSQLRLMGNVPVIQFVNDKHYAEFVDLNNKLAIADYGEEWSSKSDLATYLISELELSMPIDNTMKEELVKLEKVDPQEIKEPELPTMVNSVFNLDHADMIDRIRKSHKKARTLKCSDETADANWASFKCNQYSNIKHIPHEDTKVQGESFNKFLHQRKIIKMQYKKSQQEHLEFNLEEQEHENNYLEIHDADKDFIFEDNDEQCIK